MKNINKISFISLIVSFPLLINCTLIHYCMCGHNAHGQLSDNFFQYLNDVMIFVLFAISLGLSLYEKHYKLKYYLYILCVLLIVKAFSFIGLIFYPLILMLHIKYHKKMMVVQDLDGRKIELREDIK